MGGHAAGEPFVLLSPASLRRIALPEGSMGSTIQVRALGIGDAGAPVLTATSNAEALRPPSPVGLACAFDAGGNLNVRWVRRSRFGWTWQDGMDAPIGESREAYRVRIEGGAGFAEVETGLPQAQFGADTIDATGGGTLTVTVVQIGDRAVSRPAIASI
jgi:hypothetical protein